MTEVDTEVLDNINALYREMVKERSLDFLFVPASIFLRKINIW